MPDPIKRTCFGNSNEDATDIRPVLPELIEVFLVHENGFYVPKRWQDGVFEKCGHLRGGGFCRANPKKEGYCHHYRCV